jgi:tetratricopeptide (TPR) repeat protein
VFFCGVQFIALGRFEEAATELGTALEIDPVSLIVATVAGWPRYFARRYDQAIAVYRKVLENAPSRPSNKRRLSSLVPGFRQRSRGRMRWQAIRTMHASA